MAFQLPKSQFIDIEHPQEQLLKSAGSGLEQVLSTLGTGLEKRNEKKALESLLGPGAGMAANLSPDIKKAYVTERVKQPAMQQRADAKRQEQLQRMASPELKEKIEGGNTAREMVHTAKNMLANLPNTSTGLVSGQIPTSWRGAAGQKFIRDANRLVLLSAQSGKGLPTRARLKLEEAAKINPSMQPEAIEEILNDIITSPEIIKAMAEAQAAEQLEEQWGGNYPNDYRRQYRTLSKKIEKELKQGAKKSEESVPVGTEEEWVNNKTGEPFKVRYDGKGWKAVQ